MKVATTYLSIKAVPALMLFTCDAWMLATIVCAALSVILLVSLIRIKRQIAVAASQFIHHEKDQPSRGLKTLTNKFLLQEQNLEKAVRELEYLGDNNADHKAEVVEGPLGDALTRLNERLNAFKISETRQSWLAQGLADISGIKGSDLSMEEYANKITNLIVKYLGASQGGFFGMSDDDQNLTLLATYAYGKRKYQDSELQVAVGCGLLGQAVLEKEILYMTDVPKDYVKITSGLGESTPRCIALVPLLYRERAHGVIELASFQVFENHQKEFLRKAAELVASELSNLYVQKQTKELLSRAQEQANQLSSQEEELRQSMEEMASTQEEMKRNEIALSEKLQEIELERAKNQAILESCADGVLTFNRNGNIEFCNAAAQDMLGFVKEEMFNKTINGLLGIMIRHDAQGRSKLIAKTGNEITTRTEVNTHDRFGNEISLLLTAACVDVKGNTLFTLFVQKISVDLF